MKSDVSPTPKKGGVTGKSETKNMLALGVRTKLVPYVDNIVQRLGDLGRPIPTLVDSIIFMIITLTSSLPERRYHHS